MAENQAPLSQEDIFCHGIDTLTFQEALTGDYVLIDVRSPKEFLDGSLPRAINVPVFDNEERSVIGTLYRQGGADLAMESGFSMVSSRLAEFTAGFKEFKDQQLAVFCARGGLRSRAVVNLLQRSGYRAFQIAGGYKSYRHMLVQTFDEFRPPLIVLHGHTGTGKTRIIHGLLEAIDLEGLAQHQSSLFGGLNRSPRTQKNFDSYLHKTICLLDAPPYFIEGESRQMGKVFLPSGLAAAMREGVLVLINCSMETRVARIVEDYPLNDDATVEQVRFILESLRRKLSSAVVDEFFRLLDCNDIPGLVYLLLVEYYDKRYTNSMQNNVYSLKVSSESIDDAVEQLHHFRQQLINTTADC